MRALGTVLAWKARVFMLVSSHMLCFIAVVTHMSPLDDDLKGSPCESNAVACAWWTGAALLQGTRVSEGGEGIHLLGFCALGGMPQLTFPA